MSDWCLEHPWMTFFIVMALVSGITRKPWLSITTRERKDDK